MKTKGLWVIKFIDYPKPRYFIGYNQFDTQLRKAKIYVWKEMAEEQAVDLLRRGAYRQEHYHTHMIAGRYEIVEVEIKEK